jgi:hypothetical protein
MGTNIGAAARGGLAGVERYGTGIDRRVCRGFLALCLSGSTKTALPSGITLELIESRQRANLARREAEMVLCHHPPKKRRLLHSRQAPSPERSTSGRGADAGG